MALGNNLKKKKLIPDLDESDSGKKKTVAKKASPRTKKQAPKKKTEEKNSPVKSRKAEASKTPKPNTTKKNSKSSNASVTLNTQPQVKESPHKEDVKPKVSNHDLPVYIAQELLERKKILKDRYEEEMGALKGKPIQFVILTIGGEKYALDIDDVREVVPLPSISKTPNTPSHIKGIVNVRGSNYVVFDLSAKFDVTGDEIARYLLIIDDKDLNSSIPLSILPTTFRTNGDQISLSPQLIEDALLDASYIKGIIQNNDDLIYYLDIIELLKNDKAIVVPDKLLNELDD